MVLRLSTLLIWTVAMFAVDRINNNPDVLKNYEMKLIATDGSCTSEKVLGLFFDFITKTPQNLNFNQMAGILGEFFINFSFNWSVFL